MKWKPTPLVKMYEALGAVVDGRVHVAGDTAKIYSSSGNKFYDVTYDREARAIMVNDNASFYKGYLGYPGVAFLMQIGEIAYDKKIAERLKDVPWKDVNQKFKNDFEKALDYILAERFPHDRDIIDDEARSLLAQLEKLDLNMLGKKITPPSGY